MRILRASSEVHPYSKTGGLADMVGALGKALAVRGHKVGIVTPLYLGIRERFPAVRPLDLPLDIPLGLTRMRGEVWGFDPVPGLSVYFVDQPEFFQRSTLYQRFGVDYPDNAERFTFLSKAIAHLALHLPWKPEVVHLNDWQTALAALLLHHTRRIRGWENAPPVCMTIHNLAYQGVFPASRYPLTNLPWDYFHPDGVEFYGSLNCLKAGITYARLLTTVSPRYSREICTEQFGAGLDGLVRKRQNSLLGILNGVDYDEWTTTGNPYLPYSFSVNDLTGKISNKEALQAEFGLPVDPDVPLFGNIGRLVDQKGVEILLAALGEMIGANLQFILLGNGSPRFESSFETLAARNPSRAAVRIGFDHGLSHRVEAGCDFFLMPSHFEPCGLNQLYSLRYGTVPVVRAVGGLDDSVIDIKEDLEKADGIKFHDYSGRALAKAIRKALVLYNEMDLMLRYRRNGMTKDLSWERTAKHYVEAYESMLP
jgi:starch synthase